MKGFLKVLVGIFAFIGAAVGALAVIDKYVNKNGENRTFTKVSVRVINALDSRKVEKKQDTKFEPSFEPSEVFGDEGFQALNDEDLPF